MVVAEENASEGTEEAGKGKKKIVIIALIAIVLLGGGGAAVMLTGSGETEVAGGGEGATETAVPNDADPIYIQLDPAFVVNFQDKKNKTKFLKAELNVVTYDETVGEAIAQHMPVIRNNLILLFSRQLYEDLIPHEGKEVLRAQALAQVQTVIEKQLGKGNVDDLFFTSFVMQ